MTISLTNTREKIDISLLAIEAAEELERLKRNLDTDLESVKMLSDLLKHSFLIPNEDANLDYRLDHAAVFSNAYSNSSLNYPRKKSISEIIKEARRIASLLEPNEKRPKRGELDQLISFCVALSDSAAIYKEELEELKKRLA